MGVESEHQLLFCEEDGELWRVECICGWSAHHEQEVAALNLYADHTKSK